jgi:ABC-type antimicrobial peptide transport system permease subunit
VIVPARFLTVLLGSFAAIAVLLTVTGLYGLLSSMVAKRQREIGVRIALGAARGEVIGLVWRRAVLLVTTGLILGSAGAYGVARLLGSLESGSSSGLPAILGGACCILAMTSAVAAFVPAARAASVDPMQAFRSE